MDNNINTHPVFDGIEIGAGVWAWGDRFFWGYRQNYGEADVRAAFDNLLAGGIRFFDTAESYGAGQSEIILGRFIKNVPGMKVATKFMPYPWRLDRGSLLRALRSSLSRLGLNRVDLYQMHWPFPPVRIETWMEAMVEAASAGMVGAVGVSNYNRAQTQRAFDALARENLSLASNQVEYNLLDRRVEKNGLMQFCRERGIKVIAYSPLGMGLLTGKYSPQNAPRGVRARVYGAGLLAKAQPLIDALRKMGSDLGGKTAGQVALNWVICKGALPIPGAKNARQAEQNSAAGGWRLSEEQVAQLDNLSDRVSR
jgi:aryl-alcohol dehydrogenase-like predicted oxidoreductase